MLQVYVSNVSAISNVCCEVFYLDNAYVVVVIHICCKRMFINVSSVPDICYNKFFMLQVMHDQAWEVSADGGGPLRHSGPGRRGGPHMHAQAHGYLRTAAAGRAGPASMAATVCGDNSSSAQTGAAAACRWRGRCMHALWGPPRQSGRRRRGARVPFVGRMHLGKCVAYALS
jgi:hypothetical protein